MAPKRAPTGIVKRSKLSQRRLRKVADIIAAEPHRYTQVAYLTEKKCGTQHCIAGWAAALSSEFSTFDGNANAYGFLRDGAKVWIEGYAGKRLGLEGAERDLLFDAYWTPINVGPGTKVERVRAALYAIADGATVESVSKLATPSYRHGN